MFRMAAPGDSRPTNQGQYLIDSTKPAITSTLTRIQTKVADRFTLAPLVQCLARIFLTPIEGGALASGVVKYIWVNNFSYSHARGPMLTECKPLSVAFQAC